MILEITLKKQNCLLVTLVLDKDPQMFIPSQIKEEVEVILVLKVRQTPCNEGTLDVLAQQVLQTQIPLEEVGPQLSFVDPFDDTLRFNAVLIKDSPVVVLGQDV